MNLKKLLLPLTFLGLSPAARAADKVPGTDSIPQNKITHTVDSVKTKHHKTAKFSDYQEDEDYETAEIHRKLVNSYNAKPNAHNIDKIIKLLSIMDDPKTVYDMLRLSIPHAKYFAGIITPTLQKKLNIAAKEDIVFTAVNNHIYEMSDQEAFDFVATHSNLNKLKNPPVTLTKALNIALADKSLIGQSKAHINCISNIMNYALSHQDDKKITDLYAKIFVTTAHMIRDYNQNDSVQNNYGKSIHALTRKIETFNTHISNGSLLDKEIEIKKPHDYVIQEYANISNRINLAMIYNRAYMNFVSRALDLRHPVYSSKVTQNLYLDYVNSIEIQYLIRNQMANKDQEEQLKKLIAAHPEIKLFEPYFCNLYLNTPEYNKIMKLVAQVRTNKSKKAVPVPKEITQFLAKCEANASAQQILINNQMINVPSISLAIPKQLSMDQLRKSVLTPVNIYNQITEALDRQLHDVTFQKNSTMALTKNTQQYDR